MGSTSTETTNKNDIRFFSQSDREINGFKPTEKEDLEGFDSSLQGPKEALCVQASASIKQHWNVLASYVGKGMETSQSTHANARNSEPEVCRHVHSKAFIDGCQVVWAGIHPGSNPGFVETGEAIEKIPNILKLPKKNVVVVPRKKVLGSQ